MKGKNEDVWGMRNTERSKGKTANTHTLTHTHVYIKALYETKIRFVINII